MSENKTTCKITEQDNEFVRMTLHIDIHNYDELLSFIGLFNDWDDNIHRVLKGYGDKMIAREQ